MQRDNFDQDGGSYSAIEQLAKECCLPLAEKSEDILKTIYTGSATTKGIEGIDPKRLVDGFGHLAFDYNKNNKEDINTAISNAVQTSIFGGKSLSLQIKASDTRYEGQAIYDLGCKQEITSPSLALGFAMTGAILLSSTCRFALGGFFTLVLL